MMLMVVDGYDKFVIDELEEVKIISHKYYLNRDLELFKSDNRYETPRMCYEATRIFGPKDDPLTKYRRVVVEDVPESEKEQEICDVKAVYGLKKDKAELIVIHPLCEAYLCNNEGKTIDRIV